MIGVTRPPEGGWKGRLGGLGGLEFERERAQGLVMALGGGGGGERSETAAEIGADRYVGAHADAGRVAEEGFDALLRFGLAPAAALAAGGKGERPVGLDLEAAVLGDELVPRRQLVDVLEGGARRERGPEREALIEAERIELGPQPRVHEEGLHFRRA